jgi:hypothetical protein
MGSSFSFDSGGLVAMQSRHQQRFSHNTMKPAHVLPVLCLAGILLSMSATQSAGPIPDIGGFAIGCQAYTFNRFSVAGVLDELQRQGFEGNISIEYEHNWDHSVPEVAQCIGFVRGYTARPN